MFKEPRLVEGRQDTYSRKVFVVAPRECLVAHLIEIEPRLERFSEALYRPAVYLTPEVPFEESLEGRGPGLKRIIRRKFLEQYRTEGTEDFPVVEIPDDVFTSDDEIANQFDQWWTIREADDYHEFIDRAWITE
jgi:hypothetical protein